MKKTMITIAAIVGTTFAFAQTNFTAGYYIVNTTAKYAVITPGGDDFDSSLDNPTCYTYPSTDELKTNAGEVVIAYEVSGGKVLAFDPSGRQMVFDNVSSLTKAPAAQGAGICTLTETIQLLDGSSLTAGNYYWVIGQDVSKSTIKIQINDNKQFDVPQDKVLLLGAILKREIKDTPLNPVGN